MKYTKPELQVVINGLLDELNVCKCRVHVVELELKRLKIRRSD